MLYLRLHRTIFTSICNYRTRHSKVYFHSNMTTYSNFSSVPGWTRQSNSLYHGIRGQKTPKNGMFTFKPTQPGIEQVTFGSVRYCQTMPYPHQHNTARLKAMMVKGVKWLMMWLNGQWGEIASGRESLVAQFHKMYLVHWHLCSAMMNESNGNTMVHLVKW